MTGVPCLAFNLINSLKIYSIIIFITYLVVSNHLPRYALRWSLAVNTLQLTYYTVPYVGVRPGLRLWQLILSDPDLELSDLAATPYAAKILYVYIGNTGEFFIYKASS